MALAYCIPHVVHASPEETQKPLSALPNRIGLWNSLWNVSVTVLVSQTTHIPIFASGGILLSNRSSTACISSGIFLVIEQPDSRILLDGVNDKIHFWSTF